MLTRRSLFPSLLGFLGGAALAAKATAEPKGTGGLGIDPERCTEPLRGRTVAWSPSEWEPTVQRIGATELRNWSPSEALRPAPVRHYGPRARIVDSNWTSEWYTGLHAVPRAMRDAKLGQTVQIDGIGWDGLPGSASVTL